MARHQSTPWIDARAGFSGIISVLLCVARNTRVPGEAMRPRRRVVWFLRKGRALSVQFRIAAGVMPKTRRRTTVMCAWLEKPA